MKIRIHTSRNSVVKKYKDEDTQPKEIIHFETTSSSLLYKQAKSKKNVFKLNKIVYLWTYIHLFLGIQNSFNLFFLNFYYFFIIFKF